MNEMKSATTPRVFATLGALFVALATQAQPTIHDVYPDGATLQQSTNLLSFGVTAGAAELKPEGISVRLVSTNTAGRVVDVTLTAASGLTVGGTVTERSVSAPLAINVVGYSAWIIATDTGGLSATNSVDFDTLSPVFSVEIEDFNYNAGMFVPEPQVGGYSRDVLTDAPVDGIDLHEGNLVGGGNTAYREPGLFTEPNGDTPRTRFAAAGKTDYNVGWFDNGDWGNYSRRYPAGVYNVYYRAANGSGGTSPATLARVTSDATQYDQTTEVLGTFTVPNTGWQTYRYYGLRNGDGSLAQITLDGTRQTLRFNCGGGQNANFFALFPASTNAPVVHDVYPDGTRLYQRTNTMSFAATAADSTIAPGDISVLLAYTTIAGQSGSTNLTSAAGLTIGGTAAERTVSFSIQTNIPVYRAVIRVVDGNGNFRESTVKFGTAIPEFSFEAEDFDYNLGKFIAGDQTNGLAAPDFVAIEGVDTHAVNIAGGQFAYRNEGLNTEATGDVPRAKYAGSGLADYNVGWNDTGNWANYTRVVPPGVFNVYARAANSGTLTLAVVTGGLGTDVQTTTNLGTFTVPTTGGYQAYAWVPLKDSSGNLVKFTGGSRATFRSTTGGGHNINFYAFYPADVNIPTITGVYPNGATLFQQTNVLSFRASSPAGIDQQNVTVEVDGEPVTGLTFEGSSSEWIVRYVGLGSNTTHTADIRVEANNGSMQTVSVAFDTYNKTSFTVETEAFNHSSGMFFDNPTQDSYGSLGATPGIDALDVDLVNGNHAYRVEGLNTEVTGDVARDTLVSDLNFLDYNVGWFDNGCWGNYTRTYPAGRYNVFLRAANGTGGPGSASLARVASDPSVEGQTTEAIGTFAVPVTGGFQTYRWVPLTDANGGLAAVTFDGGVHTLRLTSGGGNNANFFILVPARAAPVETTLSISRTVDLVTLSFPTVTGMSYLVQRKQNLVDAWAVFGAAVTGDGTTKSVTDSTAAGSGFYRTSATTQP
jgi:hypothetical protein